MEGVEQLRLSLIGRMIESVDLVEDDHSRIVRLYLDDGRIISIGATGSLDDECHLVFGERRL